MAWDLTNNGWGVTDSGLSSGTTAGLFYITSSAGTKYDPNSIENASPSFSGNVCTLSVSHGAGTAKDPAQMYGYTYALKDIFGDSYSFARGDVLDVHLLTSASAAANILPVIVVHDGASGPLGSVHGFGGGLVNSSGNWLVESWRCNGSNYSVTSAVSASADTKGLTASVVSQQGTVTTVKANARDASFDYLTAVNTGTGATTFNGFTFTHITFGVILTGSYTGTIALSGGAYAVNTSGVVGAI